VIDGGEGSPGVGVHENNQLQLYIDFTIGSLTSAEIKIEFSSDNSTWYQEAFGAISGGIDTLSLGEHTIGATGKYRISTPIKDRYIRVSVKGTGTVTDSSLAILSAFGNT
jgi:hypothetical protein